MRIHLFWLVTAAVIACMINVGIAAATPKDPVASFMVAMTAKKGEIKKNKNGKYILRLRKVDTNHILSFSDQPLRVTKHISSQDLEDMWVSSVERFADTPPTAVVVIGSEMQSVKLLEISYEGDEIVFTLDDNGEALREMSGEDVCVFIDGIVMVTVTTEPVAW